MSPFIVLDLPFDCTDEDVRIAYHRLLRKFPPETSGEEFQRIQVAYKALETPRKRMEAREILKLDRTLSPLESLAEFTRLPERRKPPGAAAMRDLFRSAALAKRQQK